MGFNLGFKGLLCLMVTADLAANLKTNLAALDDVHMHKNMICPNKLKLKRHLSLVSRVPTRIYTIC
jgi:hypothetical protein